MAINFVSGRTKSKNLCKKKVAGLELINTRAEIFPIYSAHATKIQTFGAEGKTCLDLQKLLSFQGKTFAKLRSRRNGVFRGPISTRHAHTPLPE